MALAIQWVARITAISLLMFLPGVGGKWLDDWLDTNIFTLLGFGFGLCGGLAILLIMVRIAPRSSGPNSATDDEMLPDETEDLKDDRSGER